MLNSHTGQPTRNKGAMDRLESSKHLFVKEETEFINDGLHLEYEDCSSGYDSADVSDNESISSLESRDSLANLGPVRRQTEEVMNFRSTNTLCSNLRLILQMPDMCDVMFLVGPQETPVYGVRAVMGTRSCVLYQLILTHQAMTKTDNKSKKKTTNITSSLFPKVVIPVKKYDAEVFRMLVEFVHCGQVNISEDTVAGLYCGANQFKLPDLQTSCLDFVERCLLSGRAENLLTSTRAYGQHKATQTLFDKIYAVLDRRYTEVSV